MYHVYFYRDKNGRQPVLDYITELGGRKDKDSRIKFNKIGDYIEALERYGTQLKEPYIKHLEGKIWELRPLAERVFFVAWHNDSFVLLHHFTKKTQRTPRRELEQAKRELADLVERGDIDD